MPAVFSGGLPKFAMLAAGTVGILFYLGLYCSTGFL
jgi:hypothetical protein